MKKRYANSKSQMKDEMKTRNKKKKLMMDKNNLIDLDMDMETVCCTMYIHLKKKPKQMRKRIEKVKKMMSDSYHHYMTVVGGLLL